MRESKFRFSDPKLVDVDFHINEDFDKAQFDGFDMKNNVNINRLNNNEAIVSLELIIGEKNVNYPFFIRMKNLAHFKCNNEEMFNKLIGTNAPALLLSYMRPIISIITSQSGFKSFDIPFIDFTIK